MHVYMLLCVLQAICLLNHVMYHRIPLMVCKLFITLGRIVSRAYKVIVKSHYEEVIVVITRVRGGAEDECNNNDNLRVQ